MWFVIPLVFDIGPPPSPLDDPDLAAVEVARACGDLYATKRVAFTWIVEKDGQEKARRHHEWRVQEATVTVDGVAVGVPPPAEATPAQREAWAKFVNDSYWLLAPCKAADDGVRHAFDDQRRLVLTFDGVGLTPGDRYALRLDDFVVTGWDFVLQSGREGSFTWEDRKQFGPLNLATRKVGADGTVIRFEDVEAE